MTLRRSFIVRVLGLALAGWAAVCSSLGAQEQSARPYRGLFGGPSDPNSKSRLDFNVSFYGGYDDNVLANQGNTGGGQGTMLDPRFQAGSGYGGGDASLSFSRAVGESSIAFSTGTSYRYYPSLDQLSGFNHWASLGLSVPLGRRAALRLSEGVNYSPFFGFGATSGLLDPVPGEMPNLDVRQALTERPALSYSTAAAFDYRLSRRGTVSADYSLRYTDFRNESTPAFAFGSGGAGYSYRATRHATLRLGYHYRKGRHPSFFQDEALPEIEAHDIDAGVDYSRSLSLSRRTKFGFGTGSSIVRGQDQGYATTREMRTRYVLNLHANLTREIGQSWNARVDYRRGFHVVEGFAQPFFSDAVTFAAGGHAGRRVALSFSAGYTTGEVGMRSGQGSGHETWNGNAGLQVAMSSWTALYVDYLYYHYRFGSSVLLPTGLARELDRQGIRGGLRLLLPLVR